MRQVYYCKEKNCNKKIHYTTYKYGTGFCSSHAAKNRGHCHNLTSCTCNICKTIRGETFGDNNLNYKGNKALYKQKYYCNCGREIDRRSKMCYRCSNSGENSGNYIDGRTSLRGCIYKLNEAKIWKAKILKRDNYTCQECFCRGGNLEVHHIKPYAQILQEFLQRYNQFSPIEDKETLVRLAINYKDFWGITNGVTLCDKCHNLTKKGRPKRI